MTALVGDIVFAVICQGQLPRAIVEVARAHQLSYIWLALPLFLSFLLYLIFASNKGLIWLVTSPESYRCDTIYIYKGRHV